MKRTTRSNRTETPGKDHMRLLLAHREEVAFYIGTTRRPPANSPWSPSDFFPGVLFHRLCARDPNIWRRNRPMEAQAGVMQRWVTERTLILAHGSNPPTEATDATTIN